MSTRVVCIRNIDLAVQSKSVPYMQRQQVVPNATPLTVCFNFFLILKGVIYISFEYELGWGDNSRDWFVPMSFHPFCFGCVV